jgi:hypothetical protein
MRRMLSSFFVLALTLALSGCGGAESSLFATAVRNTENAGGAEIAFQASFTGPGGQSVVMTGTGVEDLSERQARIEMQVPGAGDMEVIADELVMYIHFDLLSGELGGKEWMKVDLEHTYESLGIDVGGLGQVGQGTSEQLKMLGEVSGGISEVGREQVRGVDTTHYSATVDLRKYPDEDIEKIIEVTGQSEIPMDVWIDDDQRVRRIEWQQSVAQGQAPAKIVAEYVRFGVPVDIDIPEDDEVFDATDLAVQGIENGLD